ncbi:MAG: electron transport complex subunit E [Sulfuricella sp.]|nr:electron transport complex subunit E [Sulfuricella sp.]
MSAANYREIVWNGLWKNNAGIVALLGLCPLLAVSSTLVNGVGLGLATAIVMACSNAAVSLVRRFVPNEIRIPVFIVIIAVLVTIIELLMHAYVQALYLVLGIFVPLIVVNCNVLGRAEAFASKNPLLPSMLDGFMVGLGLTLTLAVLGAIREIFGSGTLFSGIEMAFGASAKSLVVTVIPEYRGFLLAVLPPGAFIGLGLMIAGKNWIDARGKAGKPRQGG